MRQTWIFYHFLHLFKISVYCLFLRAAVIMCIFIINTLGITLYVVKWAVKWDGQIRKKFCLFYLAQWNRKNASVSGQEIKGKFSNLVRPVVTWYVFRDPGLVLVVRWSEIRDGITVMNRMRDLSTLRCRIRKLLLKRTDILYGKSATFSKM